MGIFEFFKRRRALREERREALRVGLEAAKNSVFFYRGGCEGIC